jgi:hypothetical protein
MNTTRLSPTDIGTFDAQETLIASADSGEATIRENAVQIDEFDKED